MHWPEWLRFLLLEVHLPEWLPQQLLQQQPVVLPSTLVFPKVAVVPWQCLPGLAKGPQVDLVLPQSRPHPALPQSGLHLPEWSLADLVVDLVAAMVLVQ